jgi:hypothetical protein
VAADFRDATYKKERPEKAREGGVIKSRWWEVPEEEIASLVMEIGTGFDTSDSDRQAALIRFQRLYENIDLAVARGAGFSEAVARQIVLQSGYLSLNVGAVCVNTLTAKVTKNRPRPFFLASGTSWKNQIKARNLDKWCKGFFYQTKFYLKARPVFVDGLVFGTGHLKVSEGDDGKLMCERVNPNEVYVDPLDGRDAAPRQMLQRKWVSRDILKRLYPKHAAAIDNAGRRGRVEETSSANQDVVEDTIEVWEAWHLPSGKKAKDGKHVICIDGAVLMCEEWKIDKFPFVQYRFQRRTAGYDGKGVIETVQPIQVELNKGLRSISRQMHRKGKGRTWVQIGSKVVVNNMTNNDGGDIGYYTGAPPTVDNNNAIAQEEFGWIDRLYQKAFQEVGISELSAASKKPSGLDAAVALREYSDIESERFAPQHQDWEQFSLDYVDLAIDLITKQYGWDAYKVLVPGRRDTLEVDWANVNLDRDAYAMQIWPVSSLPQTPSAQYQRAKEMMQDGFIDKTVAQRLLNFPDVGMEENLLNAMLDDADATISHILDDDEPKLMPLEPYQNLDLIIERGTAWYLFARHRNCPEDRLSLLRQLIDSATAKKVELMAPPPVPGAMPGAPPMGPPGMAPPMGAPAGGPIVNNTLNAAAPVPAVPPLTV